MRTCIYMAGRGNTVGTIIRPSMDSATISTMLAGRGNTVGTLIRPSMDSTTISTMFTAMCVNYLKIQIATTSTTQMVSTRIHSEMHNLRRQGMTQNLAASNKKNPKNRKLFQYDLWPPTSQFLFKKRMRGRTAGRHVANRLSSRFIHYDSPESRDAMPNVLIGIQF